jgi:hypothetical protein
MPVAMFSVASAAQYVGVCEQAKVGNPSQCLHEPYGRPSRSRPRREYSQPLGQSGRSQTWAKAGADAGPAAAKNGAREIKTAMAALRSAFIVSSSIERQALFGSREVDAINDNTPLTVRYPMCGSMGLQRGIGLQA